MGCKNGNHIEFSPYFKYVGGFCGDCGSSVSTEGESCQCGAEFHSGPVGSNLPCRYCYPEEFEKEISRIMEGKKRKI